MPAKPVTPRDVGVRDRLLDAADRLFYTEGVRAVGIDRVLADADAAKASLYAHFGCKDELVAAYVQRRVEAARSTIDRFVRDVPPRARALRFFDWVVEWAESADFRGCPLQHVVAELSDEKHPARLIAARQREWILGRLTEWARAAEVSHPNRVAGALMVLFDGAIAAAEQDGPKRARDARWTAEKLLGAPRR